ncbi:deaminase [Actinokineospora sp.]|uniref:deaminase n=1 Tax=Actinokineospora sp. TaxID=1872133 RepID=UPI0040381B94
MNPTIDDHKWMRRAITLSHKCPPSKTAYSVGAVVIRDGREISCGYSREDGSTIHAEESALAKLTTTPIDLSAATLYTTMEPCSQRASRPTPCAQLILATGIRRVVIAWREPALFVAECIGVKVLTAGGVTVLDLPEMADAASAANQHLALDEGSA